MSSASPILELVGVFCPTVLPGNLPQMFISQKLSFNLRPKFNSELFIVVPMLSFTWATLLLSWCSMWVCMGEDWIVSQSLFHFVWFKTVQSFCLLLLFLTMGDQIWTQYSLRNPISSAERIHMVYVSLSSSHHISLPCRCQLLILNHLAIYMHRCLQLRNTYCLLEDSVLWYCFNIFKRHFCLLEITFNSWC